jgi:hypothetical protein
MRHTEIHGDGTISCGPEANTSAQAATRAGVMTVGTEGEGSGVGAGAIAGVVAGIVTVIEKDLETGISVVSFVK